MLGNQPSGTVWRIFEQFWEIRRGIGRLLPRGLNLVWKMTLIFLMGVQAGEGGTGDEEQGACETRPIRVNAAFESFRSKLTKAVVLICERVTLFGGSDMAPSQHKTAVIFFFPLFFCRNWDANCSFSLQKKIARRTQLLLIASAPPLPP